MASLEQRLLAKAVRNDATGCLEWQGGKTSGGYGVIWNGERLEGAHRVSFRLFVGEISAGHFVLHRCDNRPCIEPTHLFEGSHSENMQDMSAKGRGSRYQLARTHCPQGHEYTEENTYRYKTPAGTTRKCRTCAIERGKERYRASRLANPS